MPPRAVLAEPLGAALSTVHDLSNATNAADLLHALTVEFKSLVECDGEGSSHVHSALRISLAASESAVRDVQFSLAMASAGFSMLREERTCFWPHFSGVCFPRPTRRCSMVLLYPVLQLHAPPVVWVLRFAPLV